MEINDVREPNQFKSETFSKYKKTSVRNQLIQSMIKGKIEPACYWSVELICAGHFMELWECILHYTGKHIHLGNPKILPYLELRFNAFRNIIQQGHHINELQLRNNTNIRKIFAEVISTLTYSERKNSFESIKINRVEEFDMTQMTERLKAPAMRYAEPIFRKEDPRELYIAINEFCFHLESKNMVNACYWVEWVIEFELICRKRREPCLCENRISMLVSDKYHRDIIWLIWEGLNIQVENMGNPFIKKLMDSLMSIFCIKYTTGACKKRRYLLYFAIALLTEPVSTDIELMPKKDLVKNTVDKIGEIYKQIKKNEQSTGTECLLKNIEKATNFEKSIRKLELMESIDF
jgi:hypothetical protein